MDDEENQDPNASPTKIRRVSREEHGPSPVARVVDVSEDMKKLVDQLATTNLTMLPSAIWQEVRSAMNNAHETWHGLQKMLSLSEFAKLVAR